MNSGRSFALLTKAASVTALLREDVRMGQPVPYRRASCAARSIARVALGAFLGFAGLSHLTFAHKTFYAQVPHWLPLNADFVIVASGVVEILLGVGLIALRRWGATVGWVTALFFVVVFPGNVSQFLTHTDAFGLNSDVARGIRLLFQPVLVVWALWCTRAWTVTVGRTRRHHAQM